MKLFSNEIKILKHYRDPYGGWIAVKRDVIKQLKLTRKMKRYSGHSYEWGKTVYLYEKDDAKVLLSELTKRGIRWKTVVIERETKCSIQNYWPYMPTCPVAQNLL